MSQWAGRWRLWEQRVASRWAKNENPLGPSHKIAVVE